MDTSRLEEYEEAADALRVKTDSFTEAAKSEEDMSDDAFVQLVRDCSDVCKIHDVPDDDRLELIFDAIKMSYFEMMEKEVDQVKWQFEAMRDL